MSDNLEFNFSEMEEKVIEYLKYGYTNSEIAKRLNFSSYTIKYYIAKIIRKTNAINRINVIYILSKNGYFNKIEQELEQPLALH